MTRQDTLDNINDLLEAYCYPCGIVRAIREDHGHRNAQEYCIQVCKVGRQLQEYGKELEGKKNIRKGADLEKQIYINLSEQGYTDSKITELYGLSRTTLHRRKKQWGIKKPKTNITKEEYLQKKKMGYSDKEVVVAYNLSAEYLLKLKTGWRLDNNH